MTVRVVAPCRLHFGLFHVPVAGFTHWPDGRPVRKFGGVGLMIETPRVTVTATPDRTNSATGSLGNRALGFLREVQTRIENAGRYALEADGPPEHVGLGVGTALGLAVASAFVPEYRHSSSSYPFGASTILAPLVGRGRRSGVGSHGFDDGGLIVDEGKAAEDDPPRVGTRVPFPNHWRVILARPQVDPLWHGDRERAAFGRDRPWEAAAATTERLRTLAHDSIVPAVRAADFDTFAASVAEFNRRAGEPFHDDQGGPYAGPEVEGVIDGLRKLGAAGVGQSSWGPTVFAFAASETEARTLAERARCRVPDLADVTVTAANNSGASVSRE